MKHVITGTLDIAYLEVGPPDGIPVILLHGFPYDVHSYDEVSVRLSTAGYRCIVPYLRGYGSTTFLSLTSPRSGQQAGLGADLLPSMATTVCVNSLSSRHNSTKRRQALRMPLPLSR